MMGISEGRASRRGVPRIVRVTMPLGEARRSCVVGATVSVAMASDFLPLLSSIVSCGIESLASF